MTRLYRKKLGRTMPEAPDLEVIKEALARRVKGLAVEQARALRPLELRVLTSTDFLRT